MNDEAAPRALIQFRLLGQVEARRDGERVELGGRKQRAALASLLVRAGRVVSLDQIVDDLWPEHPPARAAATVQVFVSNLRRALEPDRVRGAPGTVLVTASRGYQLAVEPGSVDAQEFVRLAEQGAPRSTGTIPSRPPRCCAARWSCGRARRSPTCRTRRSPGPAGARRGRSDYRDRGDAEHGGPRSDRAAPAPDRARRGARPGRARHLRELVGGDPAALSGLVAEFLAETPPLVHDRCGPRRPAAIPAARTTRRTRAGWRDQALPWR